MGRPVIDLTGKTFGGLTVIKRGKDYIRPSDGTARPQWICQCKCGNTTLVLGDKLRHGKTRSCGCL